MPLFKKTCFFFFLPSPPYFNELLPPRIVQNIASWIPFKLGGGLQPWPWKEPSSFWCRSVSCGRSMESIYLSLMLWNRVVLCWTMPNILKSCKWKYNSTVTKYSAIGCRQLDWTVLLFCVFFLCHSGFLPLSGYNCSNATVMSQA